MGQSANGKYGGVDGESYTKYGEKTSEHGHWEVGDSYAGMNKNGERWQNQTMEWVEDNRKFEAPAAEPTPESKPKSEPTGPVEFSPAVKEAQERVKAYKEKDKSIYNEKNQNNNIYYEKNKFADEYLTKAYDPIKL